MAGNNKLCPVFGQPVNQADQRHQPHGREGGFRLVKKIETAAPEPVFHQRQKALPMGLAVQGYAAVTVDHPPAQGWFPVHPVDVRSQVIKAFRPEEISPFRCPGASHDCHGFPKAGMGVMGGKRIILSEICLQHGGEHLEVLQIFAGHAY